MHENPFWKGYRCGIRNILCRHFTPPLDLQSNYLQFINFFHKMVCLFLNCFYFCSIDHTSHLCVWLNGYPLLHWICNRKPLAPRKQRITHWGPPLAWRTSSFHACFSRLPSSIWSRPFPHPHCTLGFTTTWQLRVKFSSVSWVQKGHNRWQPRFHPALFCSGSHLLRRCQERPSKGPPCVGND